MLRRASIRFPLEWPLPSLLAISLSFSVLTCLPCGAVEHVVDWEEVLVLTSTNVSLLERMSEQASVRNDELRREVHRWRELVGMVLEEEAYLVQYKRYIAALVERQALTTEKTAYRSLVDHFNKKKTDVNYGVDARIYPRDAEQLLGLLHEADKLDVEEFCPGAYGDRLGGTVQGSFSITNKAHIRKVAETIGQYTFKENPDLSSTVQYRKPTLHAFRIMVLVDSKVTFYMVGHQSVVFAGPVAYDAVPRDGDTRSLGENLSRQFGTLFQGRAAFTRDKADDDASGAMGDGPQE